MAEPTYTRQALRRLICRQMGMPFYKFYSGSSTLTATGTTTKLVDTALWQDDNFWRNAWVFMISGTAGNLLSTRYVTAFNKFETTLILDRALGATPASSDGYELLSGWSPYDVHDAMNRSIQEAFPAFSDTVTDETLVLEEDQLEYSISGLTAAPYVLLKIWIEQSGNGFQFTAASATSTTVVAPSGTDLTNVDSNWKISCYHGTGSGQVMSVASVASQTVTTTAWTTTLDSTSKCRMWDPTANVYDWSRIYAARCDAQQYPSSIYFHEKYPSLYGMRIRLQYLARPTDLTTETTAGTGTTMVPQEFIVNRAMSFLYDMKVSGGARADRQRYSALSDRHFQLAEEYKRINGFKQPEGTLWQIDDPSGSSFGSLSDPLGWMDS